MAHDTEAAMEIIVFAGLDTTSIIARELVSRSNPK
jgi:hypothetical protein